MDPALTTCPVCVVSALVPLVVFWELMGNGAKGTSFSCFLGKAGAHIPGPHLCSGVGPRNGKANSREPEAGETAGCWEGGGTCGTGWESPGVFLTHWSLTLELTALSAPVVSRGWSDVLGRPNHSFPDAFY